MQNFRPYSKSLYTRTCTIRSPGDSHTHSSFWSHVLDDYFRLSPGLRSPERPLPSPHSTVDPAFMSLRKQPKNNFQKLSVYYSPAYLHSCFCTLLSLLLYGNYWFSWLKSSSWVPDPNYLFIYSRTSILYSVPQPWVTTLPSFNALVTYMPCFFHL